MLANYLEAEPGLIARIESQVPGVRKVFGMAELASIRDRAVQFAPCACVVYDGDTIPGGDGARAGNGAAQVVLQRWVVWLIVRNVRDGADGAAARAEAGPLLSLLIAALAGWTLSASFRPLRRTTAPRPLFEQGAIHFPVAFELPLITA
ncbi:MAG: hypothetical protein HYX63_13345 [Gammaproteobacteria bacterium]|nr:hypothetical protein [Gammaproteobacteria bacterium]